MNASSAPARTEAIHPRFTMGLLLFSLCAAGAAQSIGDSFKPVDDRLRLMGQSCRRRHSTTAM
jgi:hypothetical protein